MKKELDVKCSWCEKLAIQYLMHQPFCESCSKEFVELHRKFVESSNETT